MNGSVAPFPDDSNFTDSVVRTNKILKALFFELQEDYQQANRIWRSFPRHNRSIKEHLFQTALQTSTLRPSPVVPRTEKSLLLASRYYSWNKRWGEALRLLKRNKDAASQINIQLETVRMVLYLGKYQQAKDLLLSIQSARGHHRFQYKVLWNWYLVLIGKRSEARKNITEIEENFLYVPYSAISPTGIYSSKLDSKTNLLRTLIRFPSDGENFEKLVQFYWDHEDWNALKQLIRSQRLIEGEMPVWAVLAEVYIKTNQKEELNLLLESKDGVEPIPEYYDIIARRAIREKKWELLKRISNQFIEHFPDLWDGKLYLAEYYRHTGQMAKNKQIMMELGLLGN